MEVQTLDVISVNLWSILISLCNLLILYFILKKLLFKPVKKIMAERKAAVDSIYDDANSQKAIAEESRLLYEEKLEKADDEAVAIVENARKKARITEEEILDEARKKAADTMRRADESIELERRQTVNELKGEISSLSVDIAEKIVGREINEEDHDRLIDSFIDSLEEGKN